MTTSSLFANRISALQRRIIWQQAAQFLLFAGLSAGSLYTFIIVSERFGWFSLPKDATFYSVLAGVSACIALAVVFLRRKSLVERLIEFDTRLHSHDELSTAFEYQRSGKSSLFTPALIRNAGQRLSHLDFAKLLPFPLLKFALWGGGLLLIHLSLLMVDGKIFPDVALTTDQNTPAPQETIQPEKLTTSSNTRREQRRQQEQRELFQKMNEFAQKLEKRDLPKQEFAAAVKDLLQDVQSQQEQLLDASNAPENGQTLDNLPIKQLPSAMSQTQLQNMQELLERMLQKGEDSQASSNMALGQDELGDLREALSQMAQQFEQGDDSGESDGEPTQSAGQNGENAEKTASSDTPDGTENQRAAANDQTGSGNGEDEGSKQGKISSGTGMPTGQQYGEQGQDEERDGSATAGLNPGDKQQYESSEIDASKGQVVSDKTNQATKHDYSVHIRSVTRIGNANAPTEEVIRPYRQELESVLQQEKLPLNYRKYIKNYFLSIGVAVEEKQQ